MHSVDLESRRPLVWNFGTNTPLQRPKEYAGREWLTEEDVAAANLESAMFATSERRSELTPEYDLSLNFNQFWWDLGTSTGRTSLITDPADGRLPPGTPERQAYEATPEAQRLQAVRWGLAPAHGPEELVHRLVSSLCYSPDDGEYVCGADVSAIVHCDAPPWSPQ